MGWVPAEGETFPSLGWVLLDWFAEYLRVPAGPMYGQPLVMQGWQVDAMVRWFAIDQHTGRFLYRRCDLELAKGKAKSPTAAAWAIAELCGPVVFDGWDAHGQPVGRPQTAPEIQIVATSEDQTGNTWSHTLEMLRGSPAVDQFAIDVNLGKVTLVGRRGLIEPVTSKASSRHGAPITAAVLDETHLMLPPTGVELANVVRDNLRKNAGRSMETTNAYEPGLDSVAEQTAKAAAKRPKGMLHIRDTAPFEVVDPKDPDELRPALDYIYRDTPWVDIETLLEDCMSDDMTALRIRRWFLNETVASESRLVDEELFAKVVQPHEDLEDGAPLAVGFDGSVRRDATALVGVHMVTGRAYLLGYWQRPLSAPKDWEVPRGEVMQTIALVHDRWQVAKALWDPAYWREELSSAQQQFGKDKVRPFGTSSNRGVNDAIEAMTSGFRGGTLTLDDGVDHQVLVAHVQAAHLVFHTVANKCYANLTKPEDGRRIDCAAALLYANQARLEAQRDGWEPAKAVAPFVLLR